MIKIENVVTPSAEQWAAVVRGVRNPFNSWDKSDSVLDHTDSDGYWFYMGPKDLTLLSRLSLAGDDHGKYLRFCQVTADLTAPLYWWKQLDQYKIGTVTNSCSTMHMMMSRPFTMEDFSFDYTDQKIAKIIVDEILNSLWMKYDKEDDPDKKARIWGMVNEMLPQCYNQKRTWSANYQVLKHIYHARKNHKLGEWHDLCAWIETLPYAQELIASSKK